MRRESRLAFLVIAVFVLFGLVGHTPWKPDEAYTFGLVDHIVSTGDMVVPTLAGEPFMEKPPLYFITAAAMTRLFSPPLAPYDAARLASALYMTLAFVFLALTARRLWGPGYGGLAALMLGGCLALPIVAHELITDTALLAGNAIALYGLACVSVSPRRGGLWMGMGLGIGFMAKGLLMLAFAGGIALVLPLLSPPWRTRAYAQALGLALAAAAPWLLVWPIAVYLRAPALFDQWFFANNWGRFTGASDLGPTSGHLLYLKTLPWYAWPAWPFAMWTVWRHRRSWRDEAALVLPLAVFAVMLLVLSSAREGREVYGLPMLLPLAVLAVGEVAHLPGWSVRTSRASGAVVFGVLALGLWAGWIATLLGWPPALMDRLSATAPGYVPSLSWPWLLPALAATIAWVWLVVRRSARDLGDALLVWSGGLALVWILLSSIWLPWFDWTKGYGPLMTDLRRALPARYDCIASRGLGEPQRALLEYYAHVRTRRVEIAGPPTCELYLLQTTAVSPDPGTEWRLRWAGTRPGDGKEYLRLYARTGLATAGDRDDHHD